MEHSRTPDLPAGLRALYNACSTLYPDQPNPLQVSAVVKYWLQGPDPLDYISMFNHPGVPQIGVPPHWHYISFGLSDLHGDGRVFQTSGPETPSGHGIELTFRLARDENTPPIWPAALMQALAKYVFQTESPVGPGDHFEWHLPLNDSDSRIRHLLLCQDPTLGTVDTPHGPVSFVQVVGVCKEEIEAARSWNGQSVINLLRTTKGASGPFLVTDMSRSESVFQLRPQAQQMVDEGIASEGSNLYGVSVCCSWSEVGDERGFSVISAEDSEQIKATLKKGLIGTGDTSDAPVDTNQEMRLTPASDEPRFPERVHLHLTTDSVPVFKVALCGRIKHRRPFTFRGQVEGSAVTLVPQGSEAWAIVNSEHPFGVKETWLQVFVSEAEADAILGDLSDMNEAKTFKWCDGMFTVTFEEQTCFAES